MAIKVYSKEWGADADNVGSLNVLYQGLMTLVTTPLLVTLEDSPEWDFGGTVRGWWCLLTQGGRMYLSAHIWVCKKVCFLNSTYNFAIIIVLVIILNFSMIPHIFCLTPPIYGGDKNWSIISGLPLYFRVVDRLCRADGSRSMQARTRHTPGLWRSL